jgi:biopolymer transport protein ExbB
MQRGIILMRFMRAALFGLLILLPLSSQAWWNDDWEFRKKITIDATAGTGADVQGNPADVPILIRLHTGNFGYFLDVAPNGADLRFVADDDKTPLKYHIEKFDPINEMALIWVRLPTLAGGFNTQSLWMYYGNAGATEGSDPNGTYDVNQVLVYHFSDEADSPKDATAYANDPSLFTANAKTASLIGGGLEFQGNGIIKLPASPSLQVDTQTGWTFSAWIKLAGPQDNAVLFNNIGNNQVISVVINDTVVTGQASINDSVLQTPPSPPITLSQWHHIALSVSASRMDLFVDGISAGSAPINLPAMNGVITIGAKADGESFFTGEMDELGIAKIARSADWINAQVKSQQAGSSLFLYGDDEQREQSSGGTSYFSIILKNVTVDGWVVIVLLAVMAVISWLVMLNKGMVISRAVRDNKKFLQQFREVAGRNLGGLDRTTTAEEQEMEKSPFAQAIFGKHDHFQSSNLYHIYHAGIQEVTNRIGKSVGAQAAGLSPQSLNSIRATLDATMTREAQKLNSQMVLLTISISGGPFLGLLGTVVGVMITFAAIAAAGDVNVNAIAPGVAAALVATVAGLAVAIPALFGYNYLSSRIKETVSNMRVFVDEYISMLAEHYGRDD